MPNLRTELTDLLQFPGVLQSKGVDMEALQAEALALLDTVLDQFVAAREREGGKLVAAILERVDGIAALADEVRTLGPQIRAGQRQELEGPLADGADLQLVPEGLRPGCLSATSIWAPGQDGIL